jgi:hypothetical protein
MANECPTCGRALDDFGRVHVTGEFASLSPARMGLMAGAGRAPQVAPALLAATAQCAWCGKPGGTVKKLISGPGVSICDECVALCCDILRAEIPGWPG